MDPKTRADCLPGGINSVRPCQWSTCSYHFTGNVVDEEASNGKVVFKSVPLCLLDMADAGERTLEEVADILGVSRERVRQIESKALRKVRHHLRVTQVVSAEEDHSRVNRLFPWPNG